jgi:uncharacterized protein
MTAYLDSNVFILAALSDSSKAAKAKDLIKKIITGHLEGVTSSLTIDEVVWVIWKETKNRGIAIDEGLRMLQFDNLKIMGIDRNIIKNSLIFMNSYKSLKPRDAVHLSAALSANASIIISDDSDFDDVKEIKRKSLD